LNVGNIQQTYFKLMAQLVRVTHG